MTLTTRQKEILAFIEEDTRTLDQIRKHIRTQEVLSDLRALIRAKKITINKMGKYEARRSHVPFNRQLSLI